MEFVIGLAQTCHPADGDVVALVEDYAARAQAAGVDLLVFPESLMSRYEAERAAFLAESQPIGGPFTQAIAGIAANHALWIVYTMNELNPGGLPFNTAIIVDGGGKRRGVYRKVHLFDSATTRESERMAAGDGLFDPIDTPFGRIGIGSCYDLRFPEQARAAARVGCELMIYPAAWVDGPGKALQWETLLAARAIENGMYVAGVCRADKGYVGRSCVVTPDGAVLARADASEQLITCVIDPEACRSAREAIPVLRHLRPELYRM